MEIHRVVGYAVLWMVLIVGLGSFALRPEHARLERMFGEWKVSCADGDCKIEQVGMSANAPTVLRIEQAGARNHRLILSHPNIAAEGTATFVMDRKPINTSPIARMLAPDRSSLVCPNALADSIVRQMKSHRSLVISIPGEETGVGFRLGGIGAAMDAARAHTSAR